MFRHGEFLVIPRALFEGAVGKLSVGSGEFSSFASMPAAPRTADGSILLGMGETGHAHVIRDAENLIEARVIGDIIVMDVKHPSMLVHDGYDGPREHSDIEIPVGEWVAIRQREYVDTLESRPVID